MPRLAPLVFGASLAAFCSLSTAHATACCTVRKTDDGFLALRIGPGAAFPMIRKIPSGDAVCFGSRDPDAPDTGAWIYGWYVDEAGKEHYGWVHSAYLEKECG